MFLIISAVIILLFTFYDSAQYFAVFEWTEGRRGSIFELFEGFGKNFKYAIVLFLIRILMVLLLCIFIPFLRSYGGIFLIPAFVLSWFAIFISMALNYYIPLSQILPQDGAILIAKKCFIALFDNFGFSFVVSALNVVAFILSILSFGLIPGITFMQLISMEATKIMMLKYDYLKKHPESRSKKISWAELIEAEREEY